MSRVWCPLAIELLIHYCITGGREPFRIPSKAATENEVLLEERGLISIDDQMISGYTSTKKGRFYLDALCRVPVPIAKTEWVIPEE